MGKMNVLKSSFTGKVGRVVGQKWKDVNVVHARILGKKPPTQTQTANVRAFEVLNRFASQLNKKCPGFFDLDTSRMLPHNALARGLKDCIKEKVFDLAGMDAFFEPKQYLALSQYLLDPRGGRLMWGVTVIKPIPPEIRANMVFMVVDSTGIIRFTDIREPQTYSGRLIIYVPPGLTAQPILFIAGKVNGFYTKHSFNTLGGGNMNYSQTEVPSGDIWIDGQQIFTRTKGLGILNFGANQYSAEIEAAAIGEQIIRTECTILSSDQTDKSPLFPVLTSKASNKCGYYVIVDKDSPFTEWGVMTGSDLPHYDPNITLQAYITVWYIKLR